ncbi:MAG: methyl-accepting chemotaxis protein [Bacteroidetes bacterium]|nr:methyl-accepting chemotaxis protein [Bacteroidota bacterium]
MGNSLKAMLLIVGAAIITALAAYFIYSGIAENEAKQRLMSDQRNLAISLDETWQSVSNGFVIPEKGIKTDDQLSAVHPLPSSFSADSSGRKTTGKPVVKVGLVSSGTYSVLDSVAIARVFNKLSSDTVVSGTEISLIDGTAQYFSTSPTGNVLTTITPLTANPSCLNCHGQTNPKNGFQAVSADFNEGDLIGFISVSATQPQSGSSLLWIILFSSLILAVIAILVTRSLIRSSVEGPLQAATRAVEAIASGGSFSTGDYQELSSFYASVQTISNRYRSLIDDASSMTYKVNSVVSTIESRISAVSRAAEDQLSQSRDASTNIQDLSSGIATIAQDGQTLTYSVSETTSSIQQLISNIQEASKNIQDSSGIINNIINDVQEGRFAIDQINNGMQEVNHQMEQMVTTIKKLESSSRDIGKVTEVINKIAKQTNLLAVNAAIESALAGQAGRGFAVVAEEVRKLASRSTEATREIEELVFSIREETSRAVQAALSATQTTQEGVELIRNAEVVLERITQHANRTSVIMSRLSQMMDFQIKNSQQVVLKASEMTAKASKVSTTTGSYVQTGEKIAVSIQNISSTANQNKEAAVEIYQLTRQLAAESSNLKSSIEKS